MKSSEMALRNSDLAERFNKALEKLEQDKEMMEKIRDRNLWEMIFSNNTRDLARAGISQTEAISELNAVVQDMMKLLQQCGENTASVMEELHDCMARQSDVNSDFRRKIISLAMEVLSLSVRVKNSEDKVADQSARETSRALTDRICREIDELKRRNRPPQDTFIGICRALKQHISRNRNYLNDFCKSRICSTVADAGFPPLTAEDINSWQKELAELFCPILSEIKTRATGKWDNFLRSGVLICGEVAMADAVKGILDAVADSEGDKYAEFRDELTETIGDFIASGKDVDGQYVPALKRIRKKLFENQFEIVLISEFQGGKSTTLDMLCEGREISPRGSGNIKTSAAIISVQNIYGDETQDGLEEWAEITWLDRNTIRKQICEVLESYDDPKRRLLSDDRVCTKDQNIEKLLKKAWAWNQKRPCSNTDRLDLLRVATLQYRLLKEKKLDEYLNKKIVPVDEFQSFVKFPDEWGPRWTNGFDAKFKFEEILFSIVDRVLVRIHSAALARLGCRITDCPGLFVCRWDTEKSIGAMEDADAVWYLLGAKELGKKDQEALSIIADNDLVDKCFFTVNRKDVPAQGAIQTLEADRASLQSWGFGNVQIRIYDAFKAFRAAQIESSFKGGLFERDVQCLATEIAILDANADPKRLTVEFAQNMKKCRKAIKDLVVAQAYASKEPSLASKLQSADDFSNELIAQLKSSSGIDDLLNAMEDFIVTKRAKSILVDAGSKKFLQTLTKYQNSLLDDERAAKKNYDRAEEEAKDAQNRFDQFQKEWKDTFHFLHAKSLDAGLVQDFFDMYGNGIRDTMQNRAIDICSKVWDETSFWDSSSFADWETEKKIKSEFLTLIKAKLKDYRKDLKNNPKFKSEILDPYESGVARMKQHWEQLQSENSILGDISIDDVDFEDEFHFDSFNDSLTGKIDTPWFSTNWLKAIFTLKDVKTRIREFFTKKDPIGAAYDKFCNDQKTREQFAACLGSVRLHCIKTLEKSLSDMSKSVKENIELLGQRAKKSNAGLTEIAAASNETRKTVIEPLIEKLEDFQRRVERQYYERTE